MNRYKIILILANLLLLLGYINWSIASKEKTVQRGRLVLLQLAPVDPRSLMQGDYMRLNYKLTADFEVNEMVPKRGTCAVVLDANGVATHLRMISEKTPLQPQEAKLKYFTNGWRMRLGAESYFFEEGKAARFSGAMYGGLRVDAGGNSVLTGLYDSARHLIIP